MADNEDPPNVKDPFLDMHGFLNIIGTMSPVIITFLIFLNGAVGGLAWATSLIIVLAIASLFNERFFGKNRLEQKDLNQLLNNMSYKCGVFRIPGDNIQSRLPFRIIFHFFTFVFLVSNTSANWKQENEGNNISIIIFLIVIGLLSLGDIIRLFSNKCYTLTTYIMTALAGIISGLIGLFITKLNKKINFFGTLSLLEKCTKEEKCKS